MNQLVFQREKENDLTFIKKVSLFGRCNFFIFPPKYYHSKHHPKFVAEAASKSKTKLFKLSNLDDEIFKQYFQNNIFVFKGIELWEDFDPTIHVIKYNVPVLKVSTANKLHQLAIKLKDLSFIPEIDDPVDFLIKYKSSFYNIEFDMQYLVDYLPKNDLHQFDKIIHDNDFNSFSKLFIKLYTPAYIKQIKEQFDQSLDQFRSIELFIKSKYDLLVNKFQVLPKSAIKLCVFYCSSNVIERMYKPEYLNDINSLLRNCRLTDAVVDFNYKSNNNSKRVNLIDMAQDQADKEEMFMSPLQELFKKEVLKQQKKKLFIRNTNQGRKTDEALYKAAQNYNDQSDESIIEMELDLLNEDFNRTLKKSCLRPDN